MSILIKGIDMPPIDPDVYMEFAKGSSGTTYARLTCHEGSGKWCEVIEVPSPHGRLMDAEACMRDVLENRAVKLGSGKQFDMVDMGVFACQAIDEAPTVIEAED